MKHLWSKLPAREWLRGYDRETLTADFIAAVIVTIMLIPQSLAYAMLTGVPAQMGLYASILPLVAYALLGTSRTLSVGPVAVVSLMTATAVGEIAQSGSADYITAVVGLTLLSGFILILMGVFRFGFLANFLSHPVVSGFITASGIIIALSQLKHLFGIDAGGSNLIELSGSLMEGLGNINWPTLFLGTAVLVFLWWSRRDLCRLLIRLGVATKLAGYISKAAPVVSVLATIMAAYLLKLNDMGVALVGDVPSGLPALQIPTIRGVPWHDLWGPALLIAIIGYVESVSVGKTLAAKRRQRIAPNQELIGLGAANIASAVSAGIPVTGGFSRSVVNFEAGAVTPAASIMAAVGIAAASLFLTPLLSYLPRATLAATIIIAVLSLLDFSIFARAWRYAKSDFIGVAITVAATLALGVELGVLSGVIISILLHLLKTARPHIATVGELPGTEHFRNILRHPVITYPHIVSLRVDESVYFANAAYIEDAIYRVLAENQEVKHIVLMCTAINAIDLSALEIMESVNARLRELKVGFHLSEIKGPVMDNLKKTSLIKELNGQVFLSQHDAIEALKQQ